MHLVFLYSLQIAFLLNYSNCAKETDEQDKQKEEQIRQYQQQLEYHLYQSNQQQTQQQPFSQALPQVQQHRQSIQTGNIDLHQQIQHQRHQLNQLNQQQTRLLPIKLDQHHQQFPLNINQTLPQSSTHINPNEIYPQQDNHPQWQYPQNIHQTNVQLQNVKQEIQEEHTEPLPTQKPKILIHLDACPDDESSGCTEDDFQKDQSSDLNQIESIQGINQSPEFANIIESSKQPILGNIQKPLETSASNSSGAKAIPSRKRSYPGETFAFKVNPHEFEATVRQCEKIILNKV